MNNPSAIFALAVRLLGLLFLYHAINGLSSVFLNPLSLIHEFIISGVAVWCLFGAPPLLRWAYPDTSSRGPVIPPVDQSGTACVNCQKRMPIGAAICPHCGWTQPK